MMLVFAHSTLAHTNRFALSNLNILSGATGIHFMFLDMHFFFSQADSCSLAFYESPRTTVSVKILLYCSTQQQKNQLHLRWPEGEKITAYLKFW